MNFFPGLKNGRILIIGLFFFLYSCEHENVVVSFAGDVILDRGVATEMKLHGDSILVHSIKSVSPQTNLVINCEGTFTNSNNARTKKYTFKVDKSRAKLLKAAGVTHVSVANNHTMDYGDEGYNNTIDALQNAGIKVLGQSCKPVIIEDHGVRVAIIAASFVVVDRNERDALAQSVLDQVTGFYNQEPEIPLVLYIHWGSELQSTPTRWQKDYAQKLVLNGVDVIIGHHPHVFQTVEFIDSVPVFYSIGNFVADAYLPDTYQSCMVDLVLEKQEIKPFIKPINLSSYFPQPVEQKSEQGFVRELLSYSDNICTFKTENGWQIEPAKSINFTGKTVSWLFCDDETAVLIRKVDFEKYVMQAFSGTDTSTVIYIHGKLSEFQFADINNDSKSDILLGVTKPVNFDQVKKKRLNIYSYQNNILKPLWLGTKFIYDLRCFDVIHNGNANLLSTSETDSLGKHHNFIYKWDNFGFALESESP